MILDCQQQGAIMNPVAASPDWAFSAPARQPPYVETTQITGTATSSTLSIGATADQQDR